MTLTMSLPAMLDLRNVPLYSAVCKMPGILSLVLLFVFPSLSPGEVLVLKSDEFKFVWPISPKWETTQSLTKGQYALKLKGDKLMTLGMLVFPENKMTLPALLNLHSKNPQYMFRSAKARFPESTFISSSVVKIGSHDAVQTQLEYVVRNLDSNIKIYTCLNTTIWRGLAFNIAFECLPENREEGLKEMQAALAAFSFAEDGR